MRKRKLVSLVAATSMVISLLAGCGGNNSAPASTTAADGETTVAVENTQEETTAVPENVVSGNENVENPFYVYSWNTEVGERLEYFKKAYPEYADRIVYVNTGGSDFYQGKIDALLVDEKNKQYPDLIALEADYILKYTNSDYTLDVSDLGITADDMKNMYQYTIDVATADGKVKGLSWQAAPGSMMYRRSLAKKYLGTDDPEKVQEYFKDWDTMLETARKIDQDSNGATKLFSGNDDVFRVYMTARNNAWVVDDTLTIDDAMLDYMDFNRTLEQENLTNKTTQWSDAWTANVSNDNTFAYMGCTWFLHWTLKANCGGTKAGEGTFGDWAMCQGPQNFYWGGTWLSATKGCSDPELAGIIMKFMTCDTENMKQMCEETLDYVNNREAVAELIAEGKGAYDFLGGQDFLTIFSELADGVKLPPMCGEDQSINSAFDVAVQAYAKGTKTKDEAIASFKQAVTDTFTYIKAE